VTFLRTTFTSHALNRVYERLSLSADEISSIIDNDLACLLGEETGPHDRIHKLFYSLPDDKYFVAVQDQKNGEVVTILPIDYHNKWQISANVLITSRDLILNNQNLKLIEDVDSPCSSDKEYKIRVWMKDQDGSLNTLDLQTISYHNPFRSLSELAKSSDMRKLIRNELNQIPIELSEYIYLVFLSESNYSEMVLVENI